MQILPQNYAPLLSWEKLKWSIFSVCAAQNGWGICRKRSQEPLACLYLTMRKKNNFIMLLFIFKTQNWIDHDFTAFLQSISYSYWECALFPLSIVLRTLLSFSMSFTVFCVLQTLLRRIFVDLLFPQKAHRNCNTLFVGLLFCKQGLAFLFHPSESWDYRRFLPCLEQNAWLIWNK